MASPISSSDMSAVLSQLRALSTRATGLNGPSAPGAPAAGAVGDFGKLMGEALKTVNTQQVDAQKAAENFELGKGDLASAMVSLQKAQVSFKALAEVRNKMVQAYQEIMNMPV